LARFVRLAPFPLITHVPLLYQLMAK
jgi:hypothetical protein